MAELLPQLLSLAVGDTLSPLAIAALITLLLTPRAKLNGLIFTAMTVVGVFVVTLIAALTTHGVHSTGPTHSDTLVVVLGFVFGAVFLVLGILSWRSRPKPGETAKTPSWLAAADTMTPMQVAGLGLSLAIINAKGLPIDLKAGAHIGATGWGPLAAIGLSAAFAIAASALLIAIIAVTSRNSPTITKALTRAKTDLISKNAIIMATVFIMLAAMQFSDAARMLLR